MKPGSTLGRFRITAPLGAGGMGEVYRAHDERLRRDVAIKILPGAFASDPDRLARFEREARSLAALNHPGIAAIHEVGSAPLEEVSGGPQVCHFLVMELVEGESLATRLERGPLAVAEVVPIARQIAEALEAAHDKGIVHRDLKPGNVMITPEGRVKVLDLGLAKALGAEAAPGERDLYSSPTLTYQPTATGVLLGTAAYMSPEQARGEVADARADLWGFGCVVWELLTGATLFGDATVSDTLVKVLQAAPAWEELPPSTPPALCRLLRRCLVKEAHDRWHSAADARIVLQEIEAGVANGGVVEEGHEEVTWSAPLRRLAWIAGSLVAGAVLGALLLHPRTGEEVETQSGHFSILLPPESKLDVSTAQPLALSPDGSTLAYVAVTGDGSGGGQLYLRRRSDATARPIAGTENATGPFFSPDGEWIGFFDTARLELEKVAVQGGAPVRVCDVSAEVRGGSWGRDGSIVFAPRWVGGLESVPAGGGSVREVTHAASQAGIKTLRYPYLLPDGETLLYVEGSSDILSFDDARIVAQSLATGDRKVLVRRGSGPVYLDPGVLVYSRAGALFAAPFDPATLELEAAPIPVLDGVLTSDALGVPTYAVSTGGDLIYVPGSPRSYYTRLVSIDLQGAVTPLPLDPRLFIMARLSPDGSQLAINVEGANASVWRHDLGRDTLIRLTRSWDANRPVWSPDGSRLVVQTSRTEEVRLVSMAADGSGPPTTLVTAEQVDEASLVPTSWSPDGKWLAFSGSSASSGRDLWLLPVDPPGTPQVFLRTPFNESGAGFSPDGRWLAYQTDESGRYEVVMRAAGGGGGVVPVSAQGGYAPLWSRDGRQLYYRQGRSMMAVDVTLSSQPVLGRARRLFELDEVSLFDHGRVYDLSPDGSRFVTVAPAATARPLQEIRVILGWGGEVRKKLEQESGG